MDTVVLRAFFTGLQERIVGTLEKIDGGTFRRDAWSRAEGGGGVSRLIEDGAVLERDGVLFSPIHGECLPHYRRLAIALAATRLAPAHHQKSARTRLASAGHDN
jgi:coproporphyrinogen III oxidase